MIPARAPTRFDSHLVEDVRFVHPISGRRARRLVYATPSRLGDRGSEMVGMLLACGSEPARG
jgi:hypothetical protein